MVRIVAFFNAFLLTGFIAALLFASTHARAEDAACSGKNLMHTLDKESVVKIESEAAKVKNGTFKLWKIEKEGVQPSWLYGTMHLADPRILRLGEEAQKAYSVADTIVLETDELLDETKAAAAMAANSALIMFKGETTLTSLIPPKDLEDFKKGLEKRNLPLMMFDKMKPWMLYSMLSISSCQMARLNAGVPLDVKLGRDAQKENKKVMGLETIKEQLEAMDSLPMDLHIDAVVQSAKMGDITPDITETMIALYAEGKISTIMPLSEHFDTSENNEKHMAQFEEVLLNKRNITMSDRAQKILAAGNSFIAVGAMHLVGDNGLVEKFRAMGYTVTSIEQ